jgi:hypothetical protein
MKPFNRHKTRAFALRKIWIVFLFSAIGFLLYCNTFDNPFVFDDIGRIKNNADVRLTDLSLQRILKAALGNSPSKSRPLGNLTFALNYYFHQYNVEGYHAVNISIHILTGFFLYLNVCFAKELYQGLAPF